MSEQVIDGRWEPVELIGAGGGGRVWRVIDRLRGGEAALKLVRTMSSAHRARVRREIAALQMLRIPGVVQLIDVGEHLGEPYIVMELLDGTPFPGTDARMSWTELRGPTLRLLEVLANVHATGIIHRDLKPANVLVDRTGRVVLLDFGLARGTPGDSSVTRDGALIGTPRYLAPEQFLGRRVDPRADLFALGVMLYDALAGRAPMDAVSMTSRLTTAHTMVVPPLSETAPDVPAGVARVIQALLAPMPGERPGSAADTRRALLDEGGAPEVREPLPLLAVHDALELVVAEALAGRDVHVAAEPGVGRTRFANELALRLRAAGRSALVTRAGVRPLSSLRALVPDSVMAAGPAGVEDALRARLGGGATLVLDGKEQLDPWSRKVVERLADWGRLIVIGEATASIRLSPFSAETLRTWFGGFDRFLHVPEDASNILLRRTGGTAVQVAAELDAWMLAGLATREGNHFFLDRDAIDQLEGGRLLGDQTPTEARRLSDPGGEELLAWVVLADSATAEILAAAMGVPAWEADVGLAELAKAGVAALDREGRWRARVSPAELYAWPEERVVDAHRRLAAAFPEGSAARLHQLLSAGDVAEALACATARGVRLLEAGRAARAVAGMLPVLSRARAEPSADLVEAGVSLVVRAALTDGTARTLASTAGALARLPTATSTHALELVHAHILALDGDLGGATAAARSCPPFAADELEVWRRALLVRGAIRLGLGDPDALIDEADAALLAPAARSRVETWRGQRAYEGGRYGEAAVHHRNAVATSTSPPIRALALGNLAAALLDSFDFAGAARAAAELEEVGRSLRLPRAEALGFTYGVVARYRAGHHVELGSDVLAASRAVARDNRHGSLCLTGAAQAWRLGDSAALAWADEAARGNAHREDLLAFGQAFRLALGATDVAPASIAAALGAAHPRHRLQICALMAFARPETRGWWGDRVGPPEPNVPGSTRLEVLSPDECARMLAGRPPW